MPVDSCACAYVRPMISVESKQSCFTIVNQVIRDSDGDCIALDIQYQQ